MRPSNLHKRGPRATSAGFTLVEIAVTILLFGLLFALAVPSVQSLSGSYHLKGATENLAGQLRLARERAISTGRTQHLRVGFAPITGGDYYIIDPTTAVVSARWKLPKGISYFSGAGTIDSLDMKTDGRSSRSGLVILQDNRGIRDTVSIQTSGLVLTK
jgi:prepilin-type N-terminal cleavage/methylation domain-containing protein